MAHLQLVTSAPTLQWLDRRNIGKIMIRWKRKSEWRISIEQPCGSVHSFNQVPTLANHNRPSQTRAYHGLSRTQVRISRSHRSKQRQSTKLRSTTFQPRNHFLHSVSKILWKKRARFKTR